MPTVKVAQLFLTYDTGNGSMSFAISRGKKYSKEGPQLEWGAKKAQREWEKQTQDWLGVQGEEVRLWAK